jgi:transcriptional regulator with XRE-family HTH domain
MATLKVPHQVGDLGGYLKEQRESARLSLRQLATVAGVSNPYLSQIERGLRRPSAEVLQQIAKGLQISAEALFLRAGLLEDSGGLEVEVALQSDVHLTARQKRVLLDIYATFRAENARATEADDDVAAASGTHHLKSGPAEVDGAGDDGVEVKPKRSARKRAAQAVTAPRTPDNAQGTANTPTQTSRAARTGRSGRAARSTRSRTTS